MKGKERGGDKNAENHGLKQKIIYTPLHCQEGQFDHNNKQLCLMIYPLRLMQIIRQEPLYHQSKASVKNIRDSVVLSKTAQRSAGVEFNM